MTKLLSGCREFLLTQELLAQNHLLHIYRAKHSVLLLDLIFISATIRGRKEDKSIIKSKINNLIKQKKSTQPTQIKTFGSTFKNPVNRKAWKLIKDSGCAGMSVGDAYISEKHCNFFVNRGHSKSSDLENLIYKVKSKVLDKTGINLELELQIIGEKL